MYCILNKEAGAIWKKCGARRRATRTGNCQKVRGAKPVVPRGELSVGVKPSTRLFQKAAEAIWVDRPHSAPSEAVAFCVYGQKAQTDAFRLLAFPTQPAPCPHKCFIYH